MIDVKKITIVKLRKKNAGHAIVILLVRRVFNVTKTEGVIASPE